MLSIQHILVATDFSPHSEIAVQYAAEIARAFKAEVLICHVVEEVSILAELPPGGEAYFPPNLTQIQQQQAEEKCRSLIASNGIARGEVVIGIGSPFFEIIRLAKERSADLIIVGTHGRGAIAHMLMGSVAERVVRKAPCPVLTVRQGEHEFIMP